MTPTLSWLSVTLALLTALTVLAGLVRSGRARRSGGGAAWSAANKGGGRRQVALDDMEGVGHGNPSLPAHRLSRSANGLPELELEQAGHEATSHWGPVPLPIPNAIELVPSRSGGAALTLSGIADILARSLRREPDLAKALAWAEAVTPPAAAGAFHQLKAEICGEPAGAAPASTERSCTALRWIVGTVALARHFGYFPAGRMLDAATRALQDRIRLAQELAALRVEARLPALLLTPLPLGVAALRLLLDTTQVREALATPHGWAVLVAVTALTGAGGAWLWSLRRPPYSALPTRRRQHQRQDLVETALTDLLDRATLYASAGLGLDDALAHAAESEPLRVGHQLLERVRLGQSARDARGEEPRSGTDPLHWLAAELLSVDAAGLVAALHAQATRLRLQQLARHAQLVDRVAVSALLPFLVCIMPAMLLLAFAW